ncbi:MAG TPA: MauE/DoxX family redox-associated membrane protein [Bacteroidota bacterium]|nr:MauE/DoxX family redox-associated membrane protein [Bacteroidota bacterium]
MIASLLSNRYVVVAARILLGLTFIVASIDKIAEPTLFAKAIANYKLISGWPILVAATVLPWVELLCGLSVLSGFYLRGSSLLLFTLLTAFTAAVITGLVRGLDISCGCFTLDPEVNKIGWQKILENIGLIVTSTILFYSRTRDFVLNVE